MDSFRKSPLFRFWTRTLAVAALSYFASVAATSAVDGFDASKFAWGLIGALAGAAYAAVGAATPIEPFVGNTAHVEVPVPPAEPERVVSGGGKPPPPPDASLRSS